jgi:hypothetical protein
MKDSLELQNRNGHIMQGTTGRDALLRDVPFY